MEAAPLPKLKVQTQRVDDDIAALAAFTDPELPYTRPAFSPLYKQARQWLAERMAEAGLAVRVDAASNLIGHLRGEDDKAPPLMMGSHTDTVEAGGRFDGIVGVIGALEVARCIQESGVALRHSLEVVDFTCEEPTLVGVTPMGSRLMTGDVTPEMVAATRTPSGEPLPDAINALGGDATNLERARRRPGELAGYLELHIEQGRVLERQGYAIGVVSAVAGPCRGLITLTGQADHAGATLMGDRRDALAGAAEAVLALERVVSAPELVQDTVGTVGSVRVHPNMVNVIPGRVELWMEVRSIHQRDIDTAKERFASELTDIGRRRGLQVSLKWLHTEDPVSVPQEMQAVVAEACRDLGIPSISLPSRASHDAARLAAIVPAGMVFVPCKDGKSHTPDEWIDPEQIAQGIRVLGQALLKLDRRV